MVPELRQVQMPPVQLPDVQSVGAAQAAPLASVALQVPARQKPEVHASLPAQLVPSGCFGVQTAPWQKPEAQSPSPVQALPFDCTPQVPSTQRPDWHVAADVQGWPSACPHTFATQRFVAHSLAAAQGRPFAWGAEHIEVS